MRNQSPSPEANSRVTNPERFGYIAKEMWTRVDQLTHEFEAERREVDPGDHFARVEGCIGTAVEVRPTEGLPIVFVETKFPGISIALGEWMHLHLPQCGCDACDEQPEDVIANLEKWIGAVTHGGFEVEITKRWLRHSLTYHGDREAGAERLDRGHWRDYPALGHHYWPSWPHREP